jgi:hypothetical protein
MYGLFEIEQEVATEEGGIRRNMHLSLFGLRKRSADWLQRFVAEHGSIRLEEVGLLRDPHLATLYYLDGPHLRQVAVEAVQTAVERKKEIDAEFPKPWVIKYPSMLHDKSALTYLYYLCDPVWKSTYGNNNTLAIESGDPRITTEWDRPYWLKVCLEGNIGPYPGETEDTITAVLRITAQYPCCAAYKYEYLRGYVSETLLETKQQFQSQTLKTLREFTNSPDSYFEKRHRPDPCQIRIK